MESKDRNQISYSELRPLDQRRKSVLDKAPPKRVTSVLVRASIASVLGSSFLNGFNTGVLNPVFDIVTDFTNSSFARSSGDYLDYSADKEHILYNFIVAAYLLGAMPGALFAGKVAEKIGRRKALLINHAMSLVGAILLACSKSANSFELLIVGRFIIGVQCGFGMVVCPMYLTESAMKEVKGAIGVLYQLNVTIGILVSQILGLEALLGHVDRWDWLLAFNAVPAIVSIPILFFCPESPKYLFFNNKGSDAQKALEQFRGGKNVDVSGDLQEMIREREEAKQHRNYNMLEIMTSHKHGRALLIAVVLNLAQQITGINAVFFYSNKIYGAAQLDKKTEAPYVTVATGVINVIATCVAVRLVERMGRRPLLILGEIGMAVSTIVVTITLSIQEKLLDTHDIVTAMTSTVTNTSVTALLNVTSFMNDTLSVVDVEQESDPAIKALAYISMIFVFTFVISFAIGLGCIPQFIGSEMFRTGARESAMSVACMVNWLGNFIIAISFPSIQSKLGAYTFLVFLVLLLLVIFFTWRYVPETKNTKVPEVEKMIREQDWGCCHECTSDDGYGEGHVDEGQIRGDMETNGEMMELKEVD